MQEKERTGASQRQRSRIKGTSSSGSYHNGSIWVDLARNTVSGSASGGGKGGGGAWKNMNEHTSGAGFGLMRKELAGGRDGLS